MNSHSSPPRLRLLLVDPEHDYFAQMMFLMDEIAPRRFVLEWASTYAFAVSMLRRQHFDLCLVNVRMGHRNGTDLLLEMRTLDRVVPTISASVLWEIGGTNRTGSLCLP